MRTDELVALLATNAGPADAGAARRRYAQALGAGGAGALALLALTLGVNPALADAALAPMFWIKLAYTLALAGTALALVARLARPGARSMVSAAACAVPLLAIWLLAAFALGTAGPAERSALVFGDTWRSCPFNIAMLSAPLFAALLWALRDLAPTRPALAGAAAGLLAGAAASVVYCLHCPELGAPFLGLWYPLGMLIPAAAGALAGPTVLRW